MGSTSIQASFAAVQRGSPAPAPALRRPLFFPTFDSNPTIRSVKCSAVISKSETVTGSSRMRKKGLSKASVKQAKRVKAVTMETAVSSSTDTATLPDLNYDEVAEKLENLYKLSPASVLEIEKVDNDEEGQNEEDLNLGDMRLVRGKRRKTKRLSIEKRAELQMAKQEQGMKNQDNYEDQLLRETTIMGNVNNLEWRRMKIPPVLKSAEHKKLFTLMQPMKAINELKESLRDDLQRDATNGELASRTNMTARQLRRHMVVGQAARNKLIKHNLRLVLFVMRKHFSGFSTSDNFEDLCQAGVKGLITAIDRFELKKGSHLSTYGIFWIRHSILRAITNSSFTHYPHAFESLKYGIQKAKSHLSLDLGRPPTEEEIAKKVGITKERYLDVVRATRPVYSLHATHPVTQDELIDGITDEFLIGNGRRNKDSTSLQLALDDVLDSLKPKESIVIRQRYGLDGKGERTLTEIAGNLNISRQMVRKYEVKAFMKLKHPTRLDYIRKHL